MTWQHCNISILDDGVDAEDDAVAGLDVEVLDDGRPLAGPDRHALAVDVVQAPGDRQLAAHAVLQRRGAFIRVVVTHPAQWAMV